MAVIIDVPAFRGSISGAVAAAAERLLDNGDVDELEPVGGGARAVVTDGADRFEPWVGVVDRVFTGDCDCPADAGDDGLCAHAVAVALAAFEDGIKFAAAGVPHGDDDADEDADEPERAGLWQAVEALDQRELTELVVEQALRDPAFAARLLGRES
ncbi:hypothetical protein Q0Z83_057300 [Actinoplanes sichuanensis]|uniref:SWIM zinc finger family protein n=1 Tax=Actinoplanes sichuanensis TaxID=512349 RepID=A0ABW4A565_9ACTN|nr:SWIM zinc finger family protein [Actinoplanes sichuanensis]BEL07539.1 hypothetical protein Q0Z83_057300 [Actinoplanes sichuanensis]